MKRLYRITKIWIVGKYKYLKRVNRWMRGQLVRDLLALTPDVIANMQRKYGDGHVVNDEMGQQKSKPLLIKFNKPKYIEDAE